MKKVILFTAIVLGISFTSCSGTGSSETTPNTDSIPSTIVEEVKSVIPDSLSNDTIDVKEVITDSIK